MDVNYSPTLLARAGSGTQRRQGYTLTELIVTIAIASVVLGMAIPSFASLIQNNRLTTSLNTLGATLSYARSEAIKRNQSIVICKGNAVAGCHKNQHWHEGWILFVDIDRNKAWSDEEPLLWTQAALAQGQTLDWGAFPSSNYVIYYPDGAASSNGTFTFCDNRGETAARALIIAKSGRVRVSDKSAQGTPLQCQT